jgi:hypothetical protein
MRMVNLSIAWKQDFALSEVIDLSWFHLVLRRICPLTEVVVRQKSMIAGTALPVFAIAGVYHSQDDLTAGDAELFGPLRLRPARQGWISSTQKRHMNRTRSGDFKIRGFVHT